MIRHSVGCASLDRRATCTCGAEVRRSGWPPVVLVLVLAAAAVLWVIL